MQIAFVTPSLRLGGYEKVIISYANELAARGHQVSILCGHCSGELEKNVHDNVEKIDFNARARTYLFPLSTYLRSHRVDILYSGFRDYNCICVLAKKITHSKSTCLYATQHGFQGKSILNAFQSRLLKNADRLVAVSAGVADNESKDLGLKRDNFYILGNPVLDVSAQVPTESHRWFSDAVKTPIIVMCGRLAPDKKYDIALNVVKRIKAKYDVKLLILGDGPEKQNLIAQCEDLGLSDSVDFLGYVDNPIGYMKRCSLFLHTAMQEGFGNVVVEAMYAGIPVCVTNCSGPMEIIQNGKYGMNLGSVNDRNFIENAAQKVLAVLKSEATYPGSYERALCYDIKYATDQFLRIKDGKNT